jgi:hypothetical protein
MGGLETKINAVSTKIKNREEEKNLKKEVINTLTKFYSLVKDKKIPIEKYYEKVRSFEEILTNKNKQENEVVYMCKNQLESLRSEINKKYPWTKEAFYKGFKRIFMYTEKNAIKYAEKISKEKNMDHIVIFRN